MLDRSDSSSAVLSPRLVDRWIVEARAGSTEALGNLIQNCRQYLLTVANQELSADLKAKVGPSDLVQDTAFEIQKCYHQFSGDQQAEFLAWARGILLFNLSNARRQYRQTAKRQLSREISLDDGDSWLRGNLIAKEAPPTDAAVAHERAQLVESAIKRLPEHFREVIYLRHRDHRSFTEIGERMGRTAEAVRKLWQRAIERLGEELNLPDDQR
jgi:RNA polymerase sigma-70 factor (ECF subfamily)